MSERPALITSNPDFRCPSKVAHAYSFSNAEQILFFKTYLQDCSVFYICFYEIRFLIHVLLFHCIYVQSCT